MYFSCSDQLFHKSMYTNNIMFYKSFYTHIGTENISQRKKPWFDLQFFLE